MADDLDTTQLIGEVHKKPLLYSKSDQDYLNKAKKDQTWERIAAKFRTTAKNVRTKWSYLRDKFVKELRRATISNGDRVSSWPHFQAMMFVRDSAKRKGSATAARHSPPIKVERSAALAAVAAAAAAATAMSPSSAEGQHTAQAEPNVKALIAEIQKRPLLYNRDDPDYQNKQRKDECWLEIFEALDGRMTVKQMKSKWTYLRDKLVKELKKSSRTRRKSESRWIYYDSLAFVRDANRQYDDVKTPSFGHDVADSSVSYYISSVGGGGDGSGGVNDGGAGRASSSGDIDVNLLISEILKRPLLYDVNDDDYRDQGIRDRAWEEIAALLGDPVTIEEVQATWASLRERFAKELVRTTRATNRGVRVRRRWEHFDQMLLLNECVENGPSTGQSVKFETPTLHLFDAVEYLNAAYLCADFAHTNGDHDSTLEPSGNTATTASTFPVPLSVLTENDGLATPLPAAALTFCGDGDDGSIAAAAAGAATFSASHQPLHIEEAVLRMVDIISNAVLARREHSCSNELPRGLAHTGGGHSTSNHNGHSQSVSTSSTMAAAPSDDDDRSGNEPFLEYVRHYLRHTTHANNVELKRLVTQFMHSKPTNGAH